MGIPVLRGSGLEGFYCNVVSEDSLFSSQEEADTRIILHCLHVKEQNTDVRTIIVRSPDTDVLVLLVKYWTQIGCSILVDTGTGNKRRLVDIESIVKKQGVDICSVLPAIHCFTGCDTVSAFVRRGKVGPVRLLEKHEEFVSTFVQLGEHPECSDQLLTEIEQFVCCMYGKPKYEDVNKLRFDTFCKKSEVKGTCTPNSYNSIDMSLLPPCKATLNMHTRRANYQTYVWVHAHEAYPDTPDLQKSGWKLGTDGIEHVWTKEGFVPIELADILCSWVTEDVPDDEDDNDPVETEHMLDEVYDDQ